MKSSRTKGTCPVGKGDPPPRPERQPLLGWFHCWVVETPAHLARSLILPDHRTFVSVYEISQLVTVDNAHNC